MYSKKELFLSLISPLDFQVRLAGVAYKKYLGNKIFVHAEALRLANKRISRLLSKRSAIIPGQLKDECLQLLNHYDIWFTQFRMHKKQVKPAPADPFVFAQADEQCAFPAKAEQKIKDYFLKLQEELAEKTLTEQ